MKVVLVTGMPGCGKEEFVRAAEERGFAIVRMGDTVRGEAARQNVGRTDDAIGGFAHAEREKHGYGVWAERTLSRVRGDRVLVDGLRGTAELEVFRKAFGNSLHVVAIHASPKARFARLRSRNRSDAPEAWDEFLIRDQRELAWGLGNAIATAGTMIVNEGNLATFRERAGAVLDAIAAGTNHVPQH
ncbi:MAG TPA: AAA family ATPase [Thermoplasmata archaeon]|nr:AAA family ATPase [Thermoplasmata archaeon]HLA47062.1 AAA family ATPase [Thermoplasmata archaeon]